MPVMTNTLPSPINAIAAVTHADPYPWYATLRSGPSLVYDASLKLWIASNALAVQAVLSHAQCVVRPTHEPVPTAIAASPAGEVFGHLVRMNDGERHTRPKLVLERALGAVNLTHVGARATFHSQQHALQGDSPHTLAASLNNAMLTVPVVTVAELLGFGPSQCPQVAQWMAQFVSCLSPLSSRTQLDAAIDAAVELLDQLAGLVDASQPTSGQLLHHVLAHAASCGWTERRALLCNLVGLMSQTFEATAGLIGNTWLALSRSPELLADFLAAREDPSSLGLQVQSLVNEVCRFDAPIQNTRRFVTQDALILDTPLPAGAPILLLLGSANRDSTNNQQADELQWNRAPQPYFSFGHGVHACPGRSMALVIAAAVLNQGIQTTPLDHLSSLLVDYHPSVNARNPLFKAKHDNSTTSSNSQDVT